MLAVRAETTTKVPVLFVVIFGSGAQHLDL